MKIALSEGVKAVWCNPKDSGAMIADLIGLGNSRDASDGNVRRGYIAGEDEGDGEDERNRRDDDVP